MIKGINFKLNGFCSYSLVCLLVFLSIVCSIFLFVSLIPLFHLDLLSSIQLNRSARFQSFYITTEYHPNVVGDTKAMRSKVLCVCDQTKQKNRRQWKTNPNPAAKLMASIWTWLWRFFLHCWVSKTAFLIFGKELLSRVTPPISQLVACSLMMSHFFVRLRLFGTPAQ